MKINTLNKYYKINQYKASQLEDKKIIVPLIKHHVVIIDRSGSMSSEMERVKSGILYMLENFSDPVLKLSLISYSSDGDVKLHFSKVLYQDVLSKKEYKAEVSGIHATSLTGISQSLRLAFSIADSTESTCITLHTDGWANHPSAYAEEIAIKEIVKRFKEEKPNAFINTIAYRRYSDLNLLKKIANETNGRNVLVESEREFKEELSLITTNCLNTLNNKEAPKILLKAQKGEYIIICRSDEIKVCTNQELTTELSDDLVVYHYQPISKEDFQNMPEEYPTNNEKLIFARSLFQLGNLFDGKYILKLAGTRGLYARFKNVLEQRDILTVIDHIDATLFNRAPKYQLEVIFGQKPHCSLFELLNQLKKNEAEIDLHHMLKNYKKRSVRRLQGSYDENGTFLPCQYKLKASSSEWKKIENYSVNRTSAALNIELIDECNLIDTHTQTPIHEIAGIPIHLQETKSYAVINDEYCMKNLIVRIQVQHQENFELKTGLQADWIENDYAIYEINIKETPIANQEVKFDDQVSKKLIAFTVIKKFLTAILKESNLSPYTPEQIEALKQYHITPSLNFSPPTVNPYIELLDAINNGSVDAYTSKKVNFGSVDYKILGTSKLHSGNAYFQRRFDYQNEEKPTLDLLMEDHFDESLLSIKTLSAHTRLDKVDEFTFPIYEELLGFKEINHLVSILGPVLSKKLVQAVKKKNVEALEMVKDDIEEHMSYYYNETVTPLIFAVGIAGSVEELDIGFESYQPEEMVSKFGISLSPSDKKAYFYVKDDMIISVVPTTEYYSVESTSSAH